MTNRQVDSELFALMTALHDCCKSRNIELAVAARFVGDTKVFVAKVGSDEAVVDLLEWVRNSLAVDSVDDAEGSHKVRH